MKRVAVQAYCANNFGDDLFISQLLGRYPTVAFDFFTPDLGNLAVVAGDPRVRAIDYRHFAGHASEYALHLVLGGSMFQQVHRWQFQAAGYARRFLSARRQGVPVAVVGASFGPARDRFFTLSYRSLFQLCQWISFRDEASADLFKNNPAVRCFPDLAFALDCPIPPERKGVVGVSVMDLSPAYLNAMAEIVTELARTHKEVRLYAFEEFGAHNDAAAAARIREDCAPDARDRVTIAQYDPGRVREFGEDFSSCERYLCTRFHSLVLALRTRRPLVSLAYHQKTYDTLAALGIDPPLFGDGKVPNSVPQIIEAVRSARNPGYPVPKSEAAQHFAYLDSVLG